MGIGREEWRQRETLRGRLILFYLLFVLVTLVLVGRLVQLQVIEADRYQAAARQNRIDLLPIYPARGQLLDRYNRLLAENDPAFAITLTPAALPSFKEQLQPILERLGAMLGWTPEDVADFAERSKLANPFRPLRLKGGLDWDAASRLAIDLYELPGIEIVADARRYYPMGPAAAHLLGYLGRINAPDWRRFEPEGYDLNEPVGKMGIERLDQDLLRGVNGMREVEVTAVGRVVKEVSRTPPKDGPDLHLALDLDLQSDLVKAMANRRGAAVAIDIPTGGLLAYVSTPSFDPNQMVEGVSLVQWRAWNRDANLPLLDRAGRGLYPPGSIFKIVVAWAALAEGLITPSTRVHCSGSYEVGDRTLFCWKHDGHGSVSVEQALVQSCDVFFYDVGLRLGIDTIARYAEALGLGALGDLDPLVKDPVIPNRAWKQVVKKAPWFPGETALAAIGQGYVLVNPVHMAQMMATVARGGGVKPILLERSPAGDAEPIVDDDVARVIRRALTQVVESPYGTARKSKLENGVLMAGKTGTAQVVSILRDEDGKPMRDVPPAVEDHAWFAAFAPVDHPQIAICVFVAHAGHGGEEAAPVAKRALDAYFARHPPPSPD